MAETSGAYEFDTTHGSAHSRRVVDLPAADEYRLCLLRDGDRVTVSLEAALPPTVRPVRRSTEAGPGTERYATGVMPDDKAWEHAERTYRAADKALCAEPEAAVPQPVRDAVCALGGLVSVWQGYGEDDDG